MTFHRSSCLGAVAAVLLLAAAAAQQPAMSQQDHEQHHPGASAPAQAAQPAPGTPPGTPARQGMPMGGGPGGGMGMMNDGRASGAPMMMGMAGRMAQHVEGRLAFLKAELKITDAQAPQWNVFAEAVRANARAMKEMHPAGVNPAAMKLPERIELHEKMLNAHLEALRRMTAALGPLYAALNDEQKKTADELMLSPMGFPMM